LIRLYSTGIAKALNERGIPTQGAVSWQAVQVQQMLRKADGWWGARNVPRHARVIRSTCSDEVFNVAIADVERPGGGISLYMTIFAVLIFVNQSDGDLAARARGSSADNASEG
jgi:hypothetical protein